MLIPTLNILESTTNFDGMYEIMQKFFQNSSNADCTCVCPIAKKLLPHCIHPTFLGSGSHFPFSMHIDELCPLSSSWGLLQLKVTFVPSRAGSL